MNDVLSKFFENQVYWGSKELVRNQKGGQAIVDCYFSTWYFQRKNGITYKSYKEMPKTTAEKKLNELTIAKIDEVANKFKDVVFVFPPHKVGKDISAPYLYNHIVEKGYKKIIVKSKKYEKLSQSDSKNSRWEILEDAKSSFEVVENPNITENTKYVFVDDIFTTGATMIFMMSYLHQKGLIKVMVSKNHNGNVCLENWFGIFNGRSEPDEIRKKFINVFDEKLCLEIIEQYKDEYENPLDETTLEILLMLNDKNKK